MEKRRMALINLCLEVKRIIEVELQRDDFTYLLEQPDDDREIVHPNDYEVNINHKMPVCVVDINNFEATPMELGGEVFDVCDIFIDIICTTKPESMDICEYVMKKLVGRHPFYDFSNEADVPDFNSAFDPASLPATILTQWEVDGENNFSQTTLKLTGNNDPNYAKRYSSMLTGTIQYPRDFS